MSSITFSSFIFSFGGFVIVIVCEPNNDGFVSVGVKLLNNDGGGGKFLNVGGRGGGKFLNVGGGCGGGSGIKLLNVGGGGGGDGGWKLSNIGGGGGGDIPPLLSSPLFLLNLSLLFFNLFSLFCMA